VRVRVDFIGTENFRVRQNFWLAEILRVRIFSWLDFFGWLIRFAREDSGWRLSHPVLGWLLGGYSPLPSNGSIRTDAAIHSPPFHRDYCAAQLPIGC
jgi:hypothetical protein